jgi:hypothetical protein
MSARDRKLFMILVPVATFALYWMLLMNPALDRRTALQQPVAHAQAERNQRVSAAREVTEAKQRYDQDYAELVKLSKAIPQSVAVSDLMRELNRASRGTGIRFSNITMTDATTPTEEDVPAADASQPSPVAATGLDAIPVELTFDGRFFALADLFHSLQHFVRMADGRLQVHGRLIRVDKFSFDSGSFPNITAHINATIYAAPADEGPTGGASPAGPQGAERGDGGLKPVHDFQPAAAVPR